MVLHSTLLEGAINRTLIERVPFWNPSEILLGCNIQHPLCKKNVYDIIWNSSDYWAYNIDYWAYNIDFVTINDNIILRHHAYFCYITLNISKMCWIIKLVCN